MTQARGIVFAVVALAAAIVAGCAPSEPVPSPAAPGSSGSGSAPASNPPGGGIGLGEIRYACDEAPGFLPSLLDQPATAELEQHPSAAALREAIARGGPDIDGLLPDSGYWLVSRDDQMAEYLARTPGDPPFASATLRLDADGWTLAGWGQCRPRIVLDGLSPATWVLDPEVAAPGPDASTFTALVTETVCTGGRPMGARLLPPSIQYGDDTVLVVFAARPLEGDAFDCPGNPSTRVVVALREPLGARQLLDAGVFPPADPAAPPG